MGVPASAVVLCFVLVLTEAVDVPNPSARFRDAMKSRTARQDGDECLSYLFGLSAECGEAADTNYTIVCSAECYPYPPGLYGYFACEFGGTEEGDAIVGTLVAACASNSDGVFCGSFLPENETAPNTEFINDTADALTNCGFGAPTQCSGDCSDTLSSMASAYGCCVNTLLASPLLVDLYSSITNETLWTTCGLDYPGFCDEASTGTPGPTTSTTTSTSTPTGTRCTTGGAAASVGSFVGFGLLFSVLLSVI